MQYLDAVKTFSPQNEQEQADREFFLRFAAAHPADCLLRSSDVAHFTASAWAVNPGRDKVLMVWHNLYKSWSWTGGHADGEADLAAVALRELQEETGAVRVRLVSPLPVSLEALTVDGHVKGGKFVHSHLHLNLTYLVEVAEDQPLRMKPDENSGVRWFPPVQALAASTEPWMVERVYKNLIARAK